MNDRAPDLPAPAPGPGRPAHPFDDRRRRLLQWWDRVFWWLTGAAGTLFLLLLAGLAVFLLSEGLPAFALDRGEFLVGSNWDPSTSSYGALPAIEGTLVTSALALLLAVPIAIGVAIFLTEAAPRRLRAPLAYVVDLAAAVPSIVYGVWAFYAIRPFLASDIEPGLRGLSSGGFPFASPGVPTGQDLLSASLILAIMILPTISSVSREALLAVPALSRESILSLGATRWEATKMALRGPARAGVFAGIMLGLGRAVGETIAVLIVIGDVYQTPSSLLGPGSTLAAWIANDFTAAYPGTSEKSALYALGFVLLALSLGINVLARVLVRIGSAQWARRRGHHPHRVASRALHAARDPVRALAPPWLAQARSGVARFRVWRRTVNGSVMAIAAVCTLLAILPLLGLVATAASLGGADVLRPSFYTSLPPIPPPPGQPGAHGGIGPAIEGTLLLLAIASLVAIPLGLLAAMYVSEHPRRRLSRVVTGLAEVMTGVPTLLIGVFAFALFFAVDPSFAEGALVGGVALGLVMLPIVIRASSAALRAIPSAVRESGLALGFPRNRVALRVSLGTARTGLTSGSLLALSRGGGDAAALLFTAGYAQFYASGLNGPISSLPMFIFNNYSSPSANLQAAAWGATLVLLAIMLGLHVLARVIGRSPRARPSGGSSA